MRSKIYIKILGFVASFLDAIGGSIAAPLSAKLCQKIPNEKLSLLIGITLIILNFYNCVLFFK